MNIAQNPNSELSHFAVNTPQVFEIPETFRETARQFQEAMMQYSCAIREFKTKLEVLNDELYAECKKPDRDDQGESEEAEEYCRKTAAARTSAFDRIDGVQPG